MPRARFLFSASMLACGIGLAACSDPISTERATSSIGLAAAKAASTSVTVTGTFPSQGPTDTTIDVTISGSGFDAGASATFPLNGVDDPRVHVNSTRFVSSTQLVANLRIAPDAPTVKYDVAVLDVSGKKGIGSELFTVVLRVETLAGGNVAYSVNSSGDAVGQSTTLGACGVNYLPIYWKADGTHQFLPTGTHCAGTAWAINKSGMISGQLFGPPGTALWIPQADGTYALQDLGPTPEGTLARNTGALNDTGEILGWYNNAQIYWRTPTTEWTHMIAPAGATDCAFTRAINSLGEIAARCTVNGIGYPYYWKDHSATPVALPRPSGTAPVFVQEINDSGVIVGYTSSAPYYRALRWTPSAPSTYPLVEFLPDLGKGSLAYAIANDGTIAGTFQGSGMGRAVLWSPSGSYTLLNYSGNASSGEAIDVSNPHIRHKGKGTAAAMSRAPLRSRGDRRDGQH
ncbi:MAG: hypothetical protein ABR585_13725, partial [Gemmatimonadaceae bacterium]